MIYNKIYTHIHIHKCKYIHIFIYIHNNIWKDTHQIVNSGCPWESGNGIGEWDFPLHNSEF